MPASAMKPLTLLKKRRIDLGLTQEDFADRLLELGLDVTRASVSHWERGRHPLPLNDAASRNAIAKALEMPVKDLLEMCGYEIQSDLLDEINARAQRLSEIGQLHLLMVIDWILASEEKERALHVLAQEAKKTRDSQS
jgi:transcriptional regulator with XRE-family HTH domain